jgi:hypothetical protein
MSLRVSLLPLLVLCVIFCHLLAGIPQHVTDGVLQQAHKWFALPVSHAQRWPAVQACWQFTYS